MRNGRGAKPIIASPSNSAYIANTNLVQTSIQNFWGFWDLYIAPPLEYFEVSPLIITCIVEIVNQADPIKRRHKRRKSDNVGSVKEFILKYYKH